MSDRDVAPMNADDELKHAPMYRHTAITTTHIGRFVSTLMREIVEHEGLRYDAVHIALGESGIQPQVSWQCEVVHFDTRVERQNALADALFGSIAVEQSVRAVIETLAVALFNQFTVAAPQRHLSRSELDEYRACCIAAADSSEHIVDYERYAAFHAHLGSCHHCDCLLQRQSEAEMRDDVALAE